MMARLLLVLACAAGVCVGAVHAAPAATAAAPAVASARAPAAAAPAPAVATTSASATAAAADSAAAPVAAAPEAAASTAAPAATPIASGPATAPPPAVYAPPALGSSAGNLMQTILALCFVLALLGGLAWFLKRYGPRQAGGSAQLRLVGALSLGGRERIIVVEVGDQWIVVGASPGRVNALATLPRQEGAPAQLSPHQPSAPNFAEWLKQTIDKRNAK